jgi:hypothetical protein
MNETLILLDVPLRMELRPEDPSRLPVRVVAGPQFVLGRNQKECDLVSWFLPRTEENDGETRKLSQVHALLEREGDLLRVRDVDSARGTTWNQKAVPPGEGIVEPLGLAGRLSLGRNFHLSVEWLPQSGPTCAVLRPLVAEPAFRTCLWMTGTLMGVVVTPGEAAWWLRPVAEQEVADGWLEWRAGAMWWREKEGGTVKLEDGGLLRIGEQQVRVTEV